MEPTGHGDLRQSWGPLILPEPHLFRGLDHHSSPTLSDPSPPPPPVQGLRGEAPEQGIPVLWGAGMGKQGLSEFSVSRGP